MPDNLSNASSATSKRREGATDITNGKKSGNEQANDKSRKVQKPSTYARSIARKMTDEDRVRYGL